MDVEFVTRYAKQIECMKQRIGLIESINETRIIKSHFYSKHFNNDVRPVHPGAHFPPLPPKLPRPEYSFAADLISLDDDDQVHFYVACEQGLLDHVVTFIRDEDQSGAVLQFGLEQASFGNQPSVARYLLERGTLLHSNVFGRGQPYKPPNDDMIRDVTIFDESEPAKDLVPLIQVYLDSGWHPNQAWSLAEKDHGRTPLVYKGCLVNRALVELLLKHGANPDIGEASLKAGVRSPLKSTGGDALNIAAELGDIPLVDLLLASGAEPRITKPLFSLVSCQVVPERLRRGWMGIFSGVNFSQRRPMAEDVLAAGVSCVNDVKWLPYADVAIARPLGSGYDTTALAHACAAQDWEYAEWLLEKGADPQLLDGVALTRQWWIEPDIGPNDPETVRKLVDKVKGKHLVA